MTRNPPRAKVTGMWHCQKCGKCCEKVTPDLDLQDLTRLADHLNIPMAQVVSRFCVINTVNPFTGKYRLVLRRKHQITLGGRLIPEFGAVDTASPCIFLENRECRLHRSGAKPAMCHRYICEGPVVDIRPYWNRRLLTQIEATFW